MRSATSREMTEMDAVLRYQRRKRLNALPLQFILFGILGFAFCVYTWVFGSANEPQYRTLFDDAGGGGDDDEIDISLMNLLDGEGCGEDSKMGKWGMFVWVPGILYTFAGLAIVCDEYFTGALEMIVDALGISEDVAGATFMAIASSAPELSLNMVTVPLKKQAGDPEKCSDDGDLGAGAIIGSAVCNISWIIGFSGIFARETLEIKWYPIMRDTLFFAGVTGVQYCFLMYNGRGKIKWYEAVILMSIYVLYVLLMKFNPRIQKTCMRQGQKDLTTPKPFEESEDIDLDDTERGLPSSLKVPKSKRLWFRARDRISAVVFFQNTIKRQDTQLEGEGGEDVSTSVDDEPLPRSCFGWFMFVLMAPWYFAFKYTIPQCQNEKWKKWYMLTFVNAVLWVGIIAFLMGDFATKLSQCTGINPTLAGLTIVALGTSVPDILSSVLVAREGLGGMACANALGSNIFNTLIALGLPYSIYSAAYGAPYKLDVSEFPMLIIALFCVLVLFLLIMVVFKFRLSKFSGAVLCLIYPAFVAFAFMNHIKMCPPQKEASS